MTAQWHEARRPDAVTRLLGRGGLAPAVVLLHDLAGNGAEWQLMTSSPSWMPLACRTVSC